MLGWPDCAPSPPTEADDEDVAVPPDRTLGRVRPSFTSNHQVLGRPNQEVRITASSSPAIDADPLDHRLYRSSSTPCPPHPKVVAQGPSDRVLQPPLVAPLPTNPPRRPRRLPPRAARACTQASPASLLRLGLVTDPSSLMRPSDPSRGLHNAQSREHPCACPLRPPPAQIVPDLRPHATVHCALPRRRRCALPRHPLVKWKGHLK